MKKKTKLIIIGTFVIGILAIGDKIYMDYQNEKQEFLSAIAKDKKDIEEIARWNLKDVKTVTFDYIRPENSGLEVSKWDKSVTTTPMGGSMSIHWYINGNKEITYETQLSLGKDNNRFNVLSSDGTNIIDEDNESTFKINELESKKINVILKKCSIKQKKDLKYVGLQNLILGKSDISKLKSEGKSRLISSGDIGDYLESKYKS